METQAQRIQRQREEAYLDGVKNAGLLSGKHREVTPGETERFLNRSFPVNTSEQQFRGLLSDWDMLTEDEKWKQIDNELYTGPNTQANAPITMELADTRNTFAPEDPETTLGGYGVQGMTVPQPHSYSNNNIGMSNQIVPINDPRYMNEGPETANFQLTPSEIKHWLRGPQLENMEHNPQDYAQFRRAQQAQFSQSPPPPQGILDTNTGEGVGGKYTDDPRFRRRNPFAEYLMNIGASPLFQGQSDWMEVN